MNKNMFLFLAIAGVALTGTTFTSSTEVFAQTPPPLEKSTTTVAAEEPESQQSFGKITIQISQTEQIVIDLPLKSDSKYQIVPIK